MDSKNILKTVSEWIQKYKYAAIILLVGIGMMLIPSGTKNNREDTAPSTQAGEQISIEQQLATILANVKGAGQVQVMLTTKAGEETIYQTDNNQSSSENTQSNTWDTVIVTDSDRVQSGLVRQKNGPVYQGAIIICQGANDPSVRLAMVDAVSKITGLSTDKISVLEMK